MSLGTENGALLPNGQPDPQQTLLQNRLYNDQRVRYQNQLQQQKENNDAQKAKYMADNLDFSQYGTGTPLDPAIHATLSQAIKENADKIKNGVSWPDLIYGIANTAHQVGDWSNKARQIDQNAKQAALEFKGNKSVDPNELYKYYKISAFGNNPSPDKLDPNQDYTSMALGKYGDQIIKGSGAVDDMIDKTKMIPYQKEFNVNKNGVKRIMGYSGKYSPMLHELVDDSGKPVDQNGNATGVRIKGESVNLGGQLTPGVSDEALAHFSSDKGADAYLNLLTSRVLKQNPNLNPTDLKKVLLYQYLDKNKNGYINNTKNTVDESQLERESHEREMRILGDSLIRSRQNDKQKSPFGMLGQIAAGTAPKGLVGDDGSENVTGLLPNSALFSEKVVKGPNQGPTKDAYNSINWDPQNKRFVIMDEEFEKNPDGSKKMDFMTGKPVTHTVPTYVTKDKLEPWIKNIATANGSSPEQAWKEFTSHFDVNNYDSNKTVEDELKTVPKKPWWSKFRK